MLAVRCFPLSLPFQQRRAPGVWGQLLGLLVFTFAVTPCSAALPLAFQRVVPLGGLGASGSLEATKAFAATAVAAASATKTRGPAGVPVGTTEALQELARRASIPHEGTGSPPGVFTPGRRSLCILGCTGSVGSQALQVVREFPHLFQVRALAAAGTRLKPLVQQALEFRPEFIVVKDAQKASLLDECLKEAFNDFSSSSRSGMGADNRGSPRVLHGGEALEQVARLPGVDCVLLAVSGFQGVRPALAALRAGKDVALATKEALVSAGPIFRALFQEAGASGAERTHAAETGKARALYSVHHTKAGAAGGTGLGRLLPVDSEHSAIFQALQGAPPSVYPPSKLFLCASGGPFLGRTAKELLNITVEDALKHPKWKMGAKITVDSSTLMNKGLEMIEAHEAFGVPYDSIEILIHPQAIVHSAVEMQDGAVLAQLGVPDMKLPIAYALTWPHRLPTSWPRLDFFSAGPLTFQPPDVKVFESLELASAAGRRGGLYPAALSAANEEAVAQFLQRRIHYTEIPKVVRHVLAQADTQLGVATTGSVSLEAVEQVDAWARLTAKTFVSDPTLPR